MNANQEGFHRRLDALQKILQQYNLKSTQVTPIAYVGHYPFHFNNFVYKIDLESLAVLAAFSSQQLMRFGASCERCVNDRLPSVVPAVYAWAPCRYPYIPGEAGFGWTMTEFKIGSDLDAEFPSLALDDATSATQQLARIFAAIRGAEIPGTVIKFGALTLDDQGVIASGQPPLLKAEGCVRERIDKYLASGGVENVLKDIDINNRALVHGDLTLNNVLYDSTTKRITAVLDFDWSAITHLCDEFLTGLWDIGGGIHERNEKFLPMLLSGDFSTQSDGLSVDEVRKWEVAKAWNKAITRAGAIRPSNIAGVDQVQALKDLEHSLCPFELANEVMLKRTSDEKKLSKRKETEVGILKWLDTYGNVE
ncbi:hypothetical protein F4776DRAFT_662326 [Hypoxylon sp. NC0597]|nr:hypothetical protein F4776DRAFT_662326 [Hypoxylon sp. NC0597]